MSNFKLLQGFNRDEETYWQPYDNNKKIAFGPRFFNKDLADDFIKEHDVTLKIDQEKVIKYKNHMITDLKKEIEHLTKENKELKILIDTITSILNQKD